jgi:hypothetical protein
LSIFQDDKIPCEVDYLVIEYQLTKPILEKETYPKSSLELNEIIP